MLKNSEKISYRRWRRKVQTDGLSSSVVNAIETLGRQTFFPQVLERVAHISTIETYDITNLETSPEASYRIDNYETTFTETPEIPFVTQFSKGYMIPKYGILLDENQNIINEILHPREGADGVLYDRLSRLMINDPILFFRLFNQSIKIFPNTTTLDGVAPLFPYHTNYYHWLVKTLPKIRYIWWYEDQTGENINILLPTDAPSWMEQTLDLLGVPVEKRIYPQTKVYNITNLVVPSWVAHSAEDYTWLRNKMLPKIPHKEKEKTNVFISRSDAADRHITNRDEVKTILTEYGFEEYILSELTTEECIRLFNQAEVIVGAHGAGLADIIFADNASVIELYGSRYTTSYANIAKRLGLKYKKIQCEPMYTDIRVDIEQLESAVQEAQ